MPIEYSLLQQYCKLLTASIWLKKNKYVTYYEPYPLSQIYDNLSRISNNFLSREKKPVYRSQSW